MINYTVEEYQGTCYGSNPYMFRVGIQIVARDFKTGKRRYVFESPHYAASRKSMSPCYKVEEAACHYKSGTNKADSARLDKAWKRAVKLAKKWNKTQPHA